MFVKRFRIILNLRFFSAKRGVPGRSSSLRPCFSQSLYIITDGVQCNAHNMVGLWQVKPDKMLIGAASLFRRKTSRNVQCLRVAAWTAPASVSFAAFGLHVVRCIRHRMRSPKIARPTRMMVAPSSTATSKSSVMPMERSSMMMLGMAAALISSRSPRRD